MGKPRDDQPDEGVTGPLEPVPRAAERGLGGHPPAFRPDDRIADRYRILRFIAAGGMGEVYEVADLKLGERVALKTVRPHVATSPGGVERFHREIQLARKVTHRNVCRIFDLGVHEAAQGEVLFLTMELLEGETLAHRLEQLGKTTPDQALPLVGQMAEALSEAHRAGIVHRDFKSANVMLVPSEGGERVVVTDFGLAQGGASGDPGPSQAEEGIVGTPAYMSPEQVEGAEVGPATDVYALGVVMYEMLTGHLPFEAETPTVAARKRLREAPTSPRVHLPEIDATWETVILRCLERRPADRFASATAVLRALEGGAARRRRARLALAAAAGLLALCAALVLSGRWPGARPPRRSVAVLGFKNLSGRADVFWLSTALADLFRADLAAGEKLRTISGEDVARMKIELGLAEADTYGRETLQRIRKNLASDYVVLGSYLALGEDAAGKLDLVARLQDTASGEVVVAVTDTGTQAELFELVSRAASQLRGTLGLGQRSALEGEQVRASLPSGREPARLYAEGLARLRVYDVGAARELLERAARLEPEHPLIRSALSEALLLLGYDARAAEEAKKAFDLAPKLSREGRLLVEARYRQTAHDWDRAMDIYRVLWGFFPDQLEYGLSLAEVQRQAGKTAEALATLTELRRLPPPVGEDPRIDVSEARTARILADFTRALRAAEGAVRKADAQGARLLAARGRLEECSARVRLGEMKPALEACAEAQRVFVEGGDRLRAASAQISIANVLADQGDLAAARTKYEESLAVCRALGSKEWEASVLNNIANILLDQGDLVGAGAMYERAISIHTEVGNKDWVARVLFNIGRIRYQMGELSRARRLFEESLELGRAIGDRNRIAAVLGALAGVLQAQGDPAGARRRYEEARTIGLEIGNKTLAAEILFGLAECLLQQGSVAEAKSAVEQAIEISAGTDVLSLRLTRAIVSARLRAASGAGVGEAMRNLESALAEATKAGLAREALEARLALGELEIASGSLGAGRKRLSELAQEAQTKGFGLIARRAAAAAARSARP